MSDFINLTYLFIEALIVALCVWTAMSNFRLAWNVRTLRSKYYGVLHWILGLGWLCGAFARFFWAYLVGWGDGNIWGWIWLTIWFGGSLFYGLKTDADLQLSRGKYFQDIIRANQFLTGRAVLILIGLIVCAFIGAVASYVHIH